MENEEEGGRTLKTDVVMMGQVFDRKIQVLETIQNMYGTDCDETKIFVPTLMVQVAFVC